MEIKEGGFSLIEVLITMVIMSVLVGVAVSVYTSARKSGWDSKRRADLKRIQGALELYYADKHSYPDVGDCGAGNWQDVGELASSLTPAVGNRYIDEIPEDPNRDPNISYLYCAFDGCYCLSAGMEKPDNAQADGLCGSTYTSGHTNGYYLMCP